MSHHSSQVGSQGHNQWVFVHDRIGPNPAQNRDNQDNHDNRDNQDNRDNLTGSERKHSMLSSYLPST
jgi:hypothetical protein